MAEMKTKRKMGTDDKVRLARALTLIGNHSTTHSEGSLVSEGMGRFMGHVDMISILGRSVVDLSKKKPIQGMLIQFRRLAQKDMLNQEIVLAVIDTLYKVGMETETATTSENVIGALLDIKTSTVRNKDMFENTGIAENYYRRIETAIKRIERRFDEVRAEEVNSTRTKSDLINEIKNILDQTE